MILLNSCYDSGEKEVLLFLKIVARILDLWLDKPSHKALGQITLN